MKKRVNKLKISIFVLFVISLLVLGIITGCSKASEIDKLKAEGEQLVCQSSSAQDTAQTDTATPAEDNTEVGVTGKVADEIKKEIPEIADTQKTEENAVNAAKDTTDAEDTTSADAANPDDSTAKESVLEKVYTEGELVKLVPKATDRDNDQVTFKFSSPLNNNGEWQTKEGDEGTYYVTITATDGKSEVAKEVKLVIKAKNKAPIIDINDKLIVKEGDTVLLSPKVTDPEGKDVVVEYSGWMASNSKLTGYEDSGDYKVTIKANDGELTSAKDVAITVQNVNRAPALNNIADIEVYEGDIVTVTAKAIDADKEDKDKITYVYTGASLSADGKWQTKVGDAGTYNVKLTASDGKDKDEASFTVMVKLKNKAPSIKPMADMTGANSITVGKGQTKTITLEPVVSDEDGDKVTVTYDGWMITKTKTVTQDDAGLHTVTISASDGKEEKSINVKIEVNRPPEFIVE
ncbi:hypothetical protein HY636_03450 [Candidatus Woesearchaeota archaeon]|nr:hypothetical protein [Candidatus Woesearchaeota archaeon]